MLDRRLSTAFVNPIHHAALLAAASVLLFGSLTRAQEGEYLTGIEWPEPPITTPGNSDAEPPSDAVVLFDGKDLSAWVGGDQWKIEEGVAIVQGGDIATKKSFGDCQLHIEWSAPVPATGSSQGRGNSGVFLMDRYEMQVLDSYDNKTYFDGQAAAIYKQTPPMVNAMRPPGEWNTYDIIWTAPKFKKDGSLRSPAFITALHNGVLVLNHFKLKGNTPFNEQPKYVQHGKLPIHLQNHGNPVRYRNIWVREIKPIVGKQVREPYFRDGNGREWPAEEGVSVEGNVSLDGRPLQNGRISLNSSNAGETASANIKDGSFRLDNVKPGEYVVTVQPIEPSAEAAVPKRYGSKKMSGLIVEVTNGNNELALELRSK